MEEVKDVTRLEIAEYLAEQKKISKEEASSIVNLIFDYMVNSLKAKKTLAFKNFGTFCVKERSAREARNPRTGAKVSVPESCCVRFKMGADLKKSLKKPVA